MEEWRKGAGRGKAEHKWDPWERTEPSVQRTHAVTWERGCSQFSLLDAASSAVCETSGLSRGNDNEMKPRLLSSSVALLPANQISPRCKNRVLRPYFAD
ncbi:hypothetical protein EYF80_013733 [Liparis tanakae]|uniref:Uncharacterized protein n=1 Tax=Liparis tanakae TaxID=230148 RepID=A0A4Z2IDC7_9TELE|nr:hypothetical protein EYF80_013733 [Liparis tanakae]